MSSIQEEELRLPENKLRYGDNFKKVTQKKEQRFGNEDKSDASTSFWQKRGLQEYKNRQRYEKVLKVET